MGKKINLIESNWDLVWFNKVNYSIGDRQN